MATAPEPAAITPATSAEVRRAVALATVWPRKSYAAALHASPAYDGGDMAAFLSNVRRYGRFSAERACSGTADEWGGALEGAAPAWGAVHAAPLPFGAVVRRLDPRDAAVLHARRQEQAARVLEALAMDEPDGLAHAAGVAIERDGEPVLLLRNSAAATSDRVCLVDLCAASTAQAQAEVARHAQAQASVVAAAAAAAVASACLLLRRRA